jgi:hypothetical protein
MSTKTSECLSAAGIKTIVWIDDYFAPPSHDELVDAIRACIDKLKESQVTNIDSGYFSGIQLSQSKAAIETACDNIIEGLNEEQLNESLKQLVASSGIGEPIFKSPADDFTAEEFGALKKAFGNGLTTFCLDEWTRIGAGRYANVSSDTLFLIDKEYKRESPSYDGTTILADLTAKKEGFCILLTHTYAEDEQEDRRKEIAEKIKRSAHRFCVLSKRQTSDLAIDPKFARAITTAMTHKFNGEIAHTISETITKTAIKTANVLTEQSVYDLEQALFKNSAEEGVLEYDVLLRIFEIEQRYALNQALSSNEIQNLLRSSRKFRQEAPTPSSEFGKTDMSFFRGWRQREVFYDGTGLNKLHAPLTSGDIFISGQSKRYMLLGQPCDLMVRETGKRRADVGWLVLIIDESDPQAPKQPRPLPDYRYYDLKDAFGIDKKAYVDFQNMFPVDLSVLDLAVFNSDGSVKLQQNQPEPTIVLTKGWAKILKSAKNTIFPNKIPPVYRPIGLGKNAKTLEGSISGDTLVYPLTRIGKLHSVIASAILAAWATFQTRVALDHDFAEIPVENDKTSTEELNTDTGKDELHILNPAVQLQQSQLTNKQRVKKYLAQLASKMRGVFTKN